MKCPNCGYEIGKGRAKCLRCGYAIKDVSVVVEHEREEPTPTREIDPSSVHISGGSRSAPGSSGLFGDLFGDSFFGSVLDGIFGDIFGSVGYDEYGDDDEEVVAYDDFGSPIPVDIFDRDFVEVKSVEYVDEEEQSEKAYEQARSRVQDPEEDEDEQESESAHDDRHDKEKPQSGKKSTFRRIRDHFRRDNGRK